jgi:hypothetical protein
VTPTLGIVAMLIGGSCRGFFQNGPRKDEGCGLASEAFRAGGIGRFQDGGALLADAGGQAVVHALRRVIADAGMPRHGVVQVKNPVQKTWASSLHPPSSSCAP